MKNSKKDKEIFVSEIYSRQAIFAELKQFDPLFSKEHDYIEITEWANGEGFDVNINTTQDAKFHLTWGQWDAIKYLIKQLNKIEQ
jgi:hypothetical protein